MKEKKIHDFPLLFNKMKKRGLSPVIATVLLVLLVLAIAAIIFLWFRGLIQENNTKFGRNVGLVCNDVLFTANLNNGILYISNDGNVPIFDFNLKLSKQGSHITESLKERFSSPPLTSDSALTPGSAYSNNIGSLLNDFTEITLMPVLLGSTDSGEKTFACDEQYGYEIQI